MDNTLLAKYFSNECSNNEVSLIEDWKRQHPQEFNQALEAFNSKLFYSKSYNAENTLADFRLKTKTEKISFWQNRQYLTLAASFIGLLLVVSGLWYDNSLKHEILNESEGISLVKLPDGSTIQLNQGSSISYKDSWFSGFNRNITLKGKAFFDIAKNPNQEFTVTTRQINVTVLGTQFMLNQKGNRTQFVHKEGKVRLEGTAIENTILVSKPGQQIIVENNEIVTNNIVDNNLYVSWTNEKIHFDGCSVEQVLQMLDDSYGLKTEVIDREFLQKQLMGSAPSDDPELIVRALSQILESEIIIKNN